MTPARIVSLIASATEIVCALGFRNRLVGRSHECDFPADVAALPALTAPKFRTDLSGAEIDCSVKAILADAVSVYRVDADRLRALAPDVIVTQTHCEVCAVSLADVERALGDWLEHRPDLVPLAPNCLADIWADFRRVAAALGAPEAGERLVAEIEAGFRRIADEARGLPRPSIACIEWIEPPMTAGNWMPELVELAGGRALFGRPGVHSPYIEFEALRAADPEIILVMPCGFDIARSLAEMPPLAARPGWADLRAVRGGRVFVADGNRYFNRPGPRLAQSLEILAELLHPERFRFGHQGSGWVRWPAP